MPLILRPPSSRESLSESLGRLGQSRRFHAVATEGLRLLAVVLGGIVLACLLDAGLGLSPLLRGLVLVSLLTVAGVMVRTRLRPALRMRTDSLSVALDLEERYPRLNDALASAVSFLDQEEQGAPARDSRRLRSAVVARARRLAERYNFREVVGARRFWLTFWLTAIVATLAFTLALVFPASARIAGTRLADPFGAHGWPPRTQVMVVHPEHFPARTAIGDRFDIHFDLHGEIPPEAVVHVRMENGGGFAKVVPLPQEETPGPRRVAMHLEPGMVTGSFSFAVTANDADTGWQDVIASPPPKLVPRDGRASPQVHAEFPAYTRLAAIDLTDGVGVIDAPVGTTFTLRAATDLPMRSAMLTYLGDRSAVERAAPFAFVGHTNALAGLGARLLAGAMEADIPIALGADQRTLDATFRPSLSGLYALRMTDETGITGTRLLELRLQPDPQPQVVLQGPIAGKDPEIYAPDVALTFAANAEDRLFALRSLFLQYRFTRDEAYQPLSLHDGPAFHHASPAVGGGWLTECDPRPVQFEQSRLVPLPSFRHRDGSLLRAGDTLYVRAAADDWDDVLAVKEPGHSVEIEIRITTREGIDAFLQKELAELRKSLLQLRSQQKEARGLTKGVEPLADGTLVPEHRDRLQNAEQIQKQIQGKVADARDGLRLKADRLRDTARLNGLPREGTRERVESVADGLGRLADRELGSIEPLLGEARQSATTPKPGGAATVADLLTRAGRRQKAAEDALDTLLQNLEQWGSAGEIAGEARGLRDALDQQRGKIGDVSPNTEVEKTAGKLDQLADQAGGVLARAGRFAEEKRAQAAAATARAEAKEAEAKQARDAAAAAPAGSEEQRAAQAKAQALTAEAEAERQAAAQATTEAEALRGAIQAAGGQALPEDVRKAAGALRGNRPGEARDATHRAAEALDALGQALIEPRRNRQDPALQGPQAADRLDALAEAQDLLRKKVRDAAALPDPVARAEAMKGLAKEQERLRGETEEMLQKLRRNRTDGATRDLQAAVDQMEAARDDLERGQTPAQPQGDAIDKLEQARDRLDQGAKPDARELSRETRRKLADQVRALRDRQAAAVTEADRLVTEAQRVKGWTRPLQASLDDLAGRERSLAPEVRGLIDKRFDNLPVLQRLLNEAADSLEVAEQRIGDRLEDIVAADANQGFDAKVEVDAAARFRTPMTRALRRLDQLLDALKDEEKPKASPPEPGMETPPPMGDAGEEGDLVPPLAQLKVLRALQQELNERTARFAKDHPDAARLTPEEQDELKELEQAQRDIAGLFEEVAAMVPMKPEAP